MRVEGVQTVRAEGTVSVTQGGARFDAKHRLFYRQPGQYRIEIEAEPFLGLFEASLVALAGGDSLFVYSPTHGIVFEATGGADLEMLSPELRWVGLEEVRGVLLGLPDLAGRIATGPTLRPDRDGLYQVSFEKRSGVQTVWLDPKTLSVQKIEIRDGAGDLLAESTYDYPAGDLSHPRRVRVKCPARYAVISLTYSQFDVNAEIDPEMFVLEVPANVHRFRPDD